MSLREQSLKGGAYLGSREVLGIAIRLLGILLLTRLIGPEDFGIYAGAFAIVYLLTAAAQLGTDAYLMRLPVGEARRERFDEAFSLVLVSSTLVTAVSLAVTAIVYALVGETDWLLPFTVLVISIPLNSLWAPGQALIERDLRYRHMAALEVGSDIVLYLVAVPLAVAGAGVWAPVTGQILMQVWLLVGSFWLARYRPRWRWARSRFKAMTRFGLGYAGGALLLAKPTDIVGPLIVGPFLGAEAVGFVALISRIIDTLGFAQRATRRLSLVVFGRVQTEKDRLAAAVRDSMALQLLALGIPLLAFGLIADAAIPALFGSDWEGASLLYPTFALAFFLSAVFSVQSYAMAVLDRNGVVLLSCAIQLAVLAALCWLLIPVMDLDGVGVARLVSVAGLAVIHWSLRTQVEISYQKALVWLVTLGPAIAMAALPFPWNGLAVVVGLAGILTATGREQLRELLAVAASFVSPRHRRSSQPSEVVP